MADGGRADMLLHQAFIFASMAHAKHFADAAELFVGGQELVSIWVPDGHASRELATILDVEQHARHKPGNLASPLGRNQRALRGPGKVTDGHQATFVMKIAHC